MTTAARDELIRIFPQWFISAAEHHDYVPGQVMKFSPGRWFFPDFSFHDDHTDYVVMLFVDVDALVDELLAHEPGSFHFYGINLKLPSRWSEMKEKHIQDCLWWALDHWFYYFSSQVGFNTDIQKFKRGQVPGDLLTACYFDTFSNPENPNVQFAGEI